MGRLDDRRILNRNYSRHQGGNLFKHNDSCTGGTLEPTAQGDGFIMQCPVCGAIELPDNTNELVEGAVAEPANPSQPSQGEN